MAVGNGSVVRARGKSDLPLGVKISADNRYRAATQVTPVAVSPVAQEKERSKLQGEAADRPLNVNLANLKRPRAATAVGKSSQGGVGKQKRSEQEVVGAYATLLKEKGGVKAANALMQAIMNGEIRGDKAGGMLIVCIRRYMGLDAEKQINQAKAFLGTLEGFAQEGRNDAAHRAAALDAAQKLVDILPEDEQERHKTIIKNCRESILSGQEAEGKV